MTPRPLDAVPAGAAYKAAVTAPAEGRGDGAAEASSLEPGRKNNRTPPRLKRRGVSIVVIS